MLKLEEEILRHDREGKVRWFVIATLDGNWSDSLRWSQEITDYWEPGCFWKEKKGGGQTLKKMILCAYFLFLFLTILSRNKWKILSKNDQLKASDWYQEPGFPKFQNLGEVVANLGLANSNFFTTDVTFTTFRKTLGV